MKLNLRINNKHINEGLQGEPTGCAIAQALKDRVRNILDVAVFPSHFYVSVVNNKKVKYYKGNLPKAASYFIKKFDNNKELVLPFSLTLNAKPTKKSIATI